MLQCTPELHLTLLSSVRLDRADPHLPVGSLHESGPTLDPLEDPYRELSRVVLFPTLQQTFQKIIVTLELLYATLCIINYFSEHPLFILKKISLRLCNNISMEYG